ncbi:hypothetical protein OAK57_03220 [Synechococcus sp. AH-551-N23]|nr:hypothetical protein [Synechococcus sp. AH-551-N23]
MHFSNHPRSHPYSQKKKGGGEISSALTRLRYGEYTFAYRYLPLAELLPLPAIQGLRSRPLGESTRMAERPIPVDLAEEVKHGQQHPASEAVTEGRAKPPHSSVLHQALTLASDPQLL